MSRREHARGVKNQQRMRKVARAENPNTDKQAAKGNWKRLQSDQERALCTDCDRPFADEQPKARHGDQAGKKCPEKNSAVGVVGDLKKPQSGERTDDSA